MPCCDVHLVFLADIVHIICMRSVLRLVATQTQGCMHGADLPAPDVTPLSPSSVPKHPIRHLHERAQQDGKLLKFVGSISDPRTEVVSPMEEAEQKRKNGQIPAGITPEQAAEDAQQVCTCCMLLMIYIQHGSKTKS